MWTEIFTAIALVLVIEGFLPFISPATYKSAIQSMLGQTDNNMRWIGLSSMLVGVVLLTVVR